LEKKFREEENVLAGCNLQAEGCILILYTT